MDSLPAGGLSPALADGEAEHRLNETHAGARGLNASLPHHLYFSHRFYRAPPILRVCCRTFSYPRSRRRRRHATRERYGCARGNPHHDSQTDACHFPSPCRLQSARHRSACAHPKIIRASQPRKLRFRFFLNLNHLRALRGAKGHRLDSRQRESSISQLLTADPKSLRRPQVEENARTCALFSRFLQRTRESWTGWRREADSNLRDPSGFGARDSTRVWLTIRHE